MKKSYQSRKQNTTVMLSMTIQPELKNTLTVIADQRGITRSNLIAELLQQAVESAA